MTTDHCHCLAEDHPRRSARQDSSRHIDEHGRSYWACAWCGDFVAWLSEREVAALRAF